MAIHVEIWENNSKHPSIDKLLEGASIAHQQTIKTREWFLWKYTQSPFGEALIIYATDNNGELAGMLAFGKYIHQYNDVELLSALSYETYVLPNYRGKGVFVQMIKKALDTLKQQNIAFVFNFPNSSSLQGFLKTGWVQKENISYRIKIGLTLRLFLNFKDLKKPFIAHIKESKADEIKDFCLNVDESRQAIQNAIIAKRTSAYFNWRYLGENKTNYIVVKTPYGDALFRKGYRGKLIEIQLLEIIATPENYNTLAKKIFAYAKKKVSFDIIGICIPIEHPFYTFVKSSGFIKVPTKTNFTYFVLDNSISEKLNNAHWVFTANEFHMY